MYEKHVPFICKNPNNCKREEINLLLTWKLGRNCFVNRHPVGGGKNLEPFPYTSAVLTLRYFEIRHVVRGKWREVWVWEYERRRIGLERTKLYLANRGEIVSVLTKKDQIRAEKL